MIQFTIPGEPIAKGRPRVTKTGIAFTPARTVRYESLVRLAAAEAVPVPVNGPLEVRIDAFFSVPQSRPEWWRMRALIGCVWHTSRPDLDNVVKAVCDGAESVAWAADATIARIVASKRYSDTPRVEVAIQCLSGAHTGTRRKRDLEVEICESKSD